MEKTIDTAINIIEENLSDSAFNSFLFAKKMNMSRTSLYRKIKAQTNLSTNDFVRNIKMKHACRLIEDPSIRISEIAYLIGYNNPRNFSKYFKTVYGKSPTEYRKSITEIIVEG